MSAQIQTSLDFAGAREGRQRFIRARTVKALWHPGEYAAVREAVIAVAARDGSCDADRIRREMQACGTWGKLRPGRKAIGCALGTLVAHHMLAEVGMVKSAVPENKGRKIRKYEPGRLWANIVSLEDGA